MTGRQAAALTAPGGNFTMSGFPSEVSPLSSDGLPAGAKVLFYGCPQTKTFERPIR
jgi:hypothetical protein